jgi:hypothetical protein
MDALERYLNLATRGLWGQKKRDVRRELEGNIREMALEFQIAGLNQTESIQRALLEFGAPQKVSLGMSNVYLIPSMIRKLALIGALSSLGVVAFNSSSAQPANTRMPIAACKDATAKTFIAAESDWDCEGTGGWVWFHIPSLRAALEPLGVKFSSPPGSPAVGASVDVTFPGERTISFYPDVTIGFRNEKDKVRSESVKIDPDYLLSSTFFDQITSLSTVLKLEDWNMARLTVGKTSFALSPDSPKVASTVFARALQAPLERFFPALLASTNPTRVSDEFLYAESSDDNEFLPETKKWFDQKFSFRIKDAKSGDVYALLSRVKAEAGAITPDSEAQSLRRASIHAINKDGLLEYRSFESDIKFISSVKDTTANEKGKSGVAVLVRFNGNLNARAPSFEIVAPDRITINVK